MDEEQNGAAAALMSVDQNAYASYWIMGVPAARRLYGEPMFSSPESTAQAVVTNFDQYQVQFAVSQKTNFGYNLMNWQGPTGRGFSLWYPFGIPTDPQGFGVVVRSAAITTRAAPKEFGTQYYHDPDTGQNYWGSPNQERNGPQGPGMYKQDGNFLKKLVPGRSD